MTSAVLTDNNFDADSNNDGILDVPAPGNWATYFPTRTGVNPPSAFYATNDGSASAGLQVPEPSTMILVGAGLLCLGFYRRRRK
ncbi:MAG: hypothetical protein A3K54_04800 [Omnitrophica WOR_2 bacterium RBG_13_44_8]|nr:MAG: hypothetical protein A3K54_04800 [Omnitrophica WOR_2 bacterium RBG_13_44_8]